MIVNELSTTIDLESTLIRAEALFRRFQRMVEAVDKKSNFPKAKLRQRLPASSSSSSIPTTPASPSSATANTSGTDSTTVATNSGTPSSPPATSGRRDDANGKDKGKGRSSEDGEELQDQRQLIITDALRGLLSRKVEVLPRKVVRKVGEGLGKVGKGGK